MPNLFVIGPQIKEKHRIYQNGPACIGVTLSSVGGGGGGF